MARESNATGFLGFVCQFILLYPTFILFFKYSIYLFLERGKEREREGEEHQFVVASHAPPTGDLVHNPGMCPDWELNQQPFGSQAHAQSLSYTSQGSTPLLNVDMKALF